MCRYVMAWAVTSSIGRRRLVNNLFLKMSLIYCVQHFRSSSIVWERTSQKLRKRFRWPSGSRRRWCRRRNRTKILQTVTTPPTRDRLEMGTRTDGRSTVVISGHPKMVSRRIPSIIGRVPLPALVNWYFRLFRQQIMNSTTDRSIGRLLAVCLHLGLALTGRTCPFQILLPIILFSLAYKNCCCNFLRRRQCKKWTNFCRWIQCRRKSNGLIVHVCMHERMRAHVRACLCTCKHSHLIRI